MERIKSIIAVIKSLMWVNKLSTKKATLSTTKKVLNLYLDKFRYIDKQTIIFLYTHAYKSLYVISENNTLVGFAIYTAKSSKEIHLKNIAIADGFEGKGFARKIMEISTQELRKHYSKISLCVACDNIRAIKIYKNCGFEIEAQNEDGWLMYMK